jgi:hypothetical protein
LQFSNIIPGPSHFHKVFSPIISRKHCRISTVLCGSPQDGVYRFDGKSFESFKKNPVDTNSIRENFIFDIAFGEGEDLYISAFNGVLM